MQKIPPYKFQNKLSETENSSLPNETLTKNLNLGSIYTPPDFAKMIATWAITTKTEKILDIGVGEGEITFACYNRLLECGAKPIEAQNLIYGSEVDLNTFKRFQKLCTEKNLEFSNIHNQDFFESTFPKISTVIGNPPFVRRSKIQNFDTILKSLKQFNLINKFPLLGLTDLYVYFILRACIQLKEGGKLAVITSDSWLTSKYGVILKDYLKTNFEVENITSLDRNIFNADVRALFTFATKKNSPAKKKLSNFVRVKNGLPAKDILTAIQSTGGKFKDVHIRQVKISTLEASSTWGIQFKHPEFYEKIEAHKKISKVRDVADTQIGIQTLAKEFFVVPKSRIELFGIEREFLEPLVKSLKQEEDFIIDKGSEPSTYLIYCDKPKEELDGKQFLAYITNAENLEVGIRGKDETVIGYQNKERIKRSKRAPWYNLKTEISKRSRAEILVPRIISRSFHPVWNKAQFVPGEFFIEFRPKNKKVKSEVYLAILSSTLFEVCIRIKSPLYGGGAYSIFPGQFKDIPVINPDNLNDEEKKALITAYKKYIKNPASQRKMIDEVIAKIIGWTIEEISELNEIYIDLTDAVNTFKKRV